MPSGDGQVRRADGEALGIPRADFEVGSPAATVTGPDERLEQPGPDETRSTGDEQSSAVERRQVVRCDLDDPVEVFDEGMQALRGHVVVQTRSADEQHGGVHLCRWLRTGCPALVTERKRYEDHDEGCHEHHGDRAGPRPFPNLDGCSSISHGPR